MSSVSMKHLALFWRLTAWAIASLALLAGFCFLGLLIKLNDADDFRLNPYDPVLLKEMKDQNTASNNNTFVPLILLSLSVALAMLLIERLLSGKLNLFSRKGSISPDR